MNINHHRNPSEFNATNPEQVVANPLIVDALMPPAG
jgi:hypothetical protein